MRPELVEKARQLRDAIVEYVRHHPDAAITDIWKATCPGYTYPSCHRVVKRLIEEERLTVSRVVGNIRFLRVAEVHDD
jgi:hypothetical protein